MNRRMGTILFGALIVSVICTFLALKMLKGRMNNGPQITTTRVVSASHNIKLGQVLSSSDLTMGEVAGAPPKGTFLKAEDLVGRGVISEVYQGEPILESRLSPKGSGGGLASVIPTGMRACAVRVDEVVGVSGFATPGMRVDVLATAQRINPVNPSDSGTVAKTLLQNIQVLSAGTDMQRDAEGKAHSVQVVNLLVAPEQAQILSLATNQMKIQLVLRNPLDTTVTDVRGVGMSSLMSDIPGAAAAPRSYAGTTSSANPTGGPNLGHAVDPQQIGSNGPDPGVVTSRPRKKGPTVEVINGTTRTEQSFGTAEEQH